MRASTSYTTPWDLTDNRYLSALATVLRGGALPYGYTITVWTSGMMLTHERGLPSVGEVLLFMVGAFAGFALPGLIVRLTGAVPFEPSYGVLRRTGMIQLLAVSGALGGATLVALIRSGIAWPLGAFVATAAYLALATFELTLLGSRGSAKSDAIGLTPTGWKDPYRGHATASPSTQRQTVGKAR